MNTSELRRKEQHRCVIRLGVSDGTFAPVPGIQLRGFILLPLLILHES